MTTVETTDPPGNNVIADVLSSTIPIEFIVEVSLWSQDGFPPLDMASGLQPYKDALLTSVRVMYCEDTTTNVCIVRDDLLLTFASSHLKQGESIASNNVTSTPPPSTKLVPQIDGVKDVGVEPLMWTTWQISFQVIQLGIRYIEQVLKQLQTEAEPGTTISSETIIQLVPEMIKHKVTKDIEESIRDGKFDELLHEYLGNDDVVSSVVGEEKETFQASIVPPATESLPQQQTQTVTETSSTTTDLNIIAIYSAIGVAIVSIAASGLAYYYHVQTRKARQPEASRKPKEPSAAAANKDSTDIGVDESAANSDDNSSSNAVEENTAKKIYPDVVIPRDIHSTGDDASSANPSDESYTGGGDLSTAAASWQIKPRRFVLQEVESQSAGGKDDETIFPTAGSMVAGSVMVGSHGAESVESSLEGWSVGYPDMNWA
jgi:hypothetical protein